MRLLLAEDDKALARQIGSALSNEGFEIDHAASGYEAHRLGADRTYELVVLDLGLPEMDGLSVLSSWRRSGIRAPVLILSARDSWTDRVEGLDAGADDYLPKPFRMQELLARARALLRRAHGDFLPAFRLGEVTFDPRTKTTLRKGERVELTAFEIDVLSYLFQNSGRFVSSSELADHVYDEQDTRGSNTLAVIILRLRKKLGSGLIETRRGLGYRIEAEEIAAA
jgi:two-component system, OmpR family, response regulator